MNKILERAYEKAKGLPTERQDEVGEILMSIVEQEESDLRLSAEQEAEVRRRLAKREPLVPAEKMRSFFGQLTD